MRRILMRRSDSDGAARRRLCKASSGAIIARQVSSTSSCVAIGFSIAAKKNASGASHTTYERPRGVCRLLVRVVSNFAPQRAAPPDAPRTEASGSRAASIRLF